MSTRGSKSLSLGTSIQLIATASLSPKNSVKRQHKQQVFLSMHYFLFIWGLAKYYDETV